MLTGALPGSIGQVDLEGNHSYKFIYSRVFGADLGCCNLLILLVGAGRFERPTPCAQGRCATRLRYAPTFAGLFILKYFPAFSKLAIGYFRFPFDQTVPKLCQNPSVWSDCANTLLLLVGLPIDLLQ